MHLIRRYSTFCLNSQNSNIYIAKQLTTLISFGKINHIKTLYIIVLFIKYILNYFFITMYNFSSTEHRNQIPIYVL